MSGRDEILERIRKATGGAPALAVPQSYRRAWDVPDADRLDRLCRRLNDYGVRVVQVTEEPKLARRAEALLAERGITSLLIPSDLPAEWRPGTPAAVEDAQQSPRELDRMAGVMTGCAVAIAETGTIVLDAGPGQGRRAVTLVPDYHLCVVRSEQVVGLVPEAIARLGPAAQEGRPITFISGPSATADIELSRVAGVHGPRTLDVILLLSEEASPAREGKGRRGKRAANGRTDSK